MVGASRGAVRLWGQGELAEGGRLWERPRNEETGVEDGDLGTSFSETPLGICLRAGGGCFMSTIWGLPRQRGGGGGHVLAPGCYCICLSVYQLVFGFQVSTGVMGGPS